MSSTLQALQRSKVTSGTHTLGNALSANTSDLSGSIQFSACRRPKEPLFCAENHRRFRRKVPGLFQRGNSCHSQRLSRICSGLRGCSTWLFTWGSLPRIFLQLGGPYHDKRGICSDNRKRCLKLKWFTWHVSRFLTVAVQSPPTDSSLDLTCLLCQPLGQNGYSRRHDIETVSRCHPTILLSQLVLEIHLNSRS